MPPDYRTPSPDAGHEAIRAPLARAVDDLAAQLKQVRGALLIGQTAFDFAETMLNAVLPLQQQATTQAGQITDLTTQATDLTGRVTALETQVADLQGRVTTLEGKVP